MSNFVTPFSRARILEWVVFPFSRGLPNPGIKPRSLAFQAYSLPAASQGKPENTGLGSLTLLQGIFLTQELNRGLLHCRRILYQLSYEKHTHKNLSQRLQKRPKDMQKQFNVTLCVKQKTGNNPNLLTSETVISPTFIFWDYLKHYWIFIFLHTFLFVLAALGLRCCAQAFSSCDEQGLLSS